MIARARDGSAAGVIGVYKPRSDEIDAMATEAYANGVSRRKMADVTEGLMVERVSRSTVSRVAKRLEQTVEGLRTAKLEQAFSYLCLDATYPPPST